MKQKKAVIPWARLWLILCKTVAFAIPVCAESPKEWYRSGREAVEAARALQPVTGRARNVILFIGDGMGVTAVTASRIREGQRRGHPGEENLLSFERLPYTALIKTYNTNQQTADSAGTITAIVTGVKTKAGVLSVDQGVTVGDHASAAGHELPTVFELAEKAGLWTGVVTTTRVTHATPAACYAHSPDRDWEDDAGLSAAARHAGFADIARQLIEFKSGDGLEVVMGGGRFTFLPKSASDPEYPSQSGRRLDGRDLTTEWLKRPQSAFVWNERQFDGIDASKTKHLLGLFEPSHMQYEHDRSKDQGGEPSLSRMTSLAIDLLGHGPKGFVLMVEGGRIDHSHHAGNAYRALDETIEFARAVRVAMDKTNPRETLVIVTADHSHPLTMAGYSIRGNPILGKVRTNKNDGTPEDGFSLDGYGLPFTTLSYANGPGYPGSSDEQPEGPKRFPHAGAIYGPMSRGRPDLRNIDTEAPDYLQECGIPLASETHSGEDVPLYASGPWAHLFHGVLEQHVIFHVMAEALGITP